MRYVQKYPIVLNATINGLFIQEIDVPIGTKLLSVTMEDGSFFVNGLVKDRQTLLTRVRIASVSTNCGVVPNGILRFLGSVVDGKFTYHLFTE